MPVVAGIDDSPVSRLVIEKALEQARWRGTELKLVHVLHLPMVDTGVLVDWKKVAAAQRDAVWAAADSHIADADVTVERVDLDGYPPDALVEYATEVEASLLVVGTRARGELASLILGSTSHRATYLASCDVLVVKSGVREG
ncbi:MAG: universal stress protein [Actinomycetota bacterium]